MTDSDYFKAHDAGCEMLGRGTGVPDTLCKVADHIAAAFGIRAPDKIIAACGGLLLAWRATANDPRTAAVPASLYLMALESFAVQKVKLDQAIADNAARQRAGLPVADSTMRVLEGITSLIGNIIHALQAEATAKGGDA